MAESAHSLAIETSGRAGSIALGRAGELLAAVDLPAQQRHAVQLLPEVDRLTRELGVQPADLGAVYVSHGPGSFTVLRIAVAVAKMLARAVGSRLVAVPTLDVVARNVDPAAHEHLAVCLNAKGGRCFTGLYRSSGGAWEPAGEPALLTLAEVLAAAGRPLALVADKLPASDTPLDASIAVLDRELARPRAAEVWHIGEAMAAAGQFVDPYALTPKYVRLPDAEEVWRKKQAARTPNGEG